MDRVNLACDRARVFIVFGTPGVESNLCNVLSKCKPTGVQVYYLVKWIVAKITSIAVTTNTRSKHADTRLYTSKNLPHAWRMTAIIQCHIVAVWLALLCFHLSFSRDSAVTFDHLISFCFRAKFSGSLAAFTSRSHQSRDHNKALFAWINVFIS